MRPLRSGISARWCDTNVTVTTTIKLQDRQHALEALARIKGVFRDRVEVEYANHGVADEMAELRQRRRARLAASDAEEGARRHLQKRRKLHVRNTAYIRRDGEGVPEA
jgi:hypothetical protein